MFQRPLLMKINKEAPMFNIGCETIEGTYIEAAFRVFGVKHMIKALYNEADKQKIDRDKLIMPYFLQEHIYYY